MNRAALRSVIKGVLRSTVALLGSGQRRSEGPRVLCYHGVTEQPSDEWSVTPAQLHEQMTIVQGEGNPVTLPQLISWLLDGGSLPERAIAVTFDDGYLDVLERAAPILDQRRIPATAFVISGLVDGQSKDVSYQPSRPLLTWQQISSLAASGWTIGAHTLSHPVLAQQTREESLRQLLESRRRIGEVLGQSITLLAYPYGTRQTVSPREWALAEEAGYRAAFLDAIGAVQRGQDRFALPRCKVLASDSLRVFRASLSGGLDRWRHVEDR